MSTRPLTSGNPKIPDVETLICRPAFGTLPAVTHTLHKYQRGNRVIVACTHCGTDWATLDAIARGKTT